MYIVTWAKGVIQKIVVSIQVDPDDAFDDELDGHAKILRAVRNRQYDTVSKLLARKPEAVETRGHMGRRPLHIAVENDDLEMVQLLLKTGADVNGTRDDPDDPRLDTPLFQVSSSEVAQCLIDHGADLHAKDRSQRTAIHWAAQFAHPEILQLLLEHGVPVNSVDDGGDTPLHWAVGASGNAFTHINSISGSNELNCVELLLANGADPNAANRYGIRPLHGLCDMPEPEREGPGGEIIKLDPQIPGIILKIVDRLLDAGADPTLKNNEGTSPLDTADESVRALMVKHFEK